MISKFFIERPVLANVLAIVIVGLAALSSLTAHDYTPVGYVDPANFLGATPLMPPLRAGATGALTDFNSAALSLDLGGCAGVPTRSRS